MNNDTLLESILAIAKEKDGRQTMTCPQAFELAKQPGVELKDIARVCNSNNIKFVRCQLGCF